MKRGVGADGGSLGVGVARGHGHGGAMASGVGRRNDGRCVDGRPYRPECRPMDAAPETPDRPDRPDPPAHHRARHRRLLRARLHAPRVRGPRRQAVAGGKARAHPRARRSRRPHLAPGRRVRQGGGAELLGDVVRALPPRDAVALGTRRPAPQGRPRGRRGELQGARRQGACLPRHGAAEGDGPARRRRRRCHRLDAARVPVDGGGRPRRQAGLHRRRRARLDRRRGEAPARARARRDRAAAPGRVERRRRASAAGTSCSASRAASPATSRRTWCASSSRPAPPCRS